MESTSKEKEPEGKNKDLKEVKVKKRSRQKRKGSSTSEREEGEEEEEGDQAVETSMKKKKKKKLIYSSPLIKGGREDIWNWPMYKTQLPVTCGDKEGFLHRDKLARGERCIVHLDRWYTPGEFEKLGGKEKNKNWKTSIRCRNKPLQKLIQENNLKCPPPKRRKRDDGQQVKRALFTSSTQTSISMSKSTKDEKISSDEAEDRNEGDPREEGDRNEGDPREEGEGREGAGERDSDHDDWDMDALAFSGNALPVQCGSVTGTLQKNRFASGNTGKCIRTEETWLTPAEFIRLNPDLTDGMWKRDITCRGQRLSYLLQRKILQVHSLLCMCRMCYYTDSDLEDQRNDDHCFICGEQGELLCCDGCPRVFHQDCHLPTPTEGDDWLCTFCVWRKTQEWLYTDHMTQRQVLDSKISENKLQCQYLLLFLLNADEQKIFTTDPCPAVSGYSSVIPRPMWLQKVRENLESHYTLVGEFVSDIRLIFRNCAIFNRNNPELRDMGIQMSTLFEGKFQRTFNISTFVHDVHHQDRHEGRGKEGLIGLIEIKSKREEQDPKGSGVSLNPSPLPTSPLNPSPLPTSPLSLSPLPTSPLNPSPLPTSPLGKSTCQSRGRRCESCAEVPDSSHWVLVKPEVSTEKSISTYSLSSPAGSYECSESGLRWSCVWPVTLKYCFIDWHLLADELPDMQFRPAGPSMDIKVISGELEDIHLPHFLCLGESQSYLKDAVNIMHKHDSGVFLEKCELSCFHARLVKPSCSPLGVFLSLKSLIFPGKQEEKEHLVKIHADVQVYRSSTSPLTFRTYLLPEDASLIKLLEKQEECFRGLRLAKPRPEEPLQMDGFYALRTTPESDRIYPARLKLRYSSIAPNFSEVRTREAGDFKLELFHPTDQRIVWEAELLRTECLLSVLQGSDGTTAAEFLRRHRADLVQKVRNVMPIADQMFSQGHISEENYANISVGRTDQDKMRCVFKVLESCGDEGKSAFIRILQEHHSELLEELPLQHLDGN